MNYLVRLAKTGSLIGLVMVLAIAIGCSSNSESIESSDSSTDGRELEEVTLQLNWFPEAEHGGYYAALVHGYFENEGIKVTVLPGGPNVPVVQSAAIGRVDFAVTNADRVLFGQQAGADVVALMAPIQNTPRCIMVHRESGIEKLSELKDVTLAVGTGPAFYQYMQKQLKLENVETIAYPGSIGPFIANKRFAQQAYVFSEPYLAKQQGADPVTLMLSEIGYNPYASTLVTRREAIESQSDLVQRMVRASVKGWRHYLDDPTETNAHIDSINPDMDMATLNYGAEQIKALSVTNNSEPLCQMTEQRWQQLIDQLAEIGLVSSDKVKAGMVFDASLLAETRQ